MDLNKRVIAERFARLPHDKQVSFLEALRAQGIDFSLLPIVPAESKGLLSHAQERQWFLWRFDPLGSAYHISGALRLVGALDHGAMQAAFDELVKRHASLRTVLTSVTSPLTGA